MCGPQASSGFEGNLALDAVCRAELGRPGWWPPPTGPPELAADTSLLLLLTGAGAPIETLLRAAAAFPPEVRRLGDRRRPAPRPRGSPRPAGVSVLRLATKDDLAGLLRWSVR